MLAQASLFTFHNFVHFLYCSYSICVMDLYFNFGYSCLLRGGQHGASQQTDYLDKRHYQNNIQLSLDSCFAFLVFHFIFFYFTPLQIASGGILYKCLYITHCIVD